MNEVGALDYPAAIFQTWSANIPDIDRPQAKRQNNAVGAQAFRRQPGIRHIYRHVHAMIADSFFRAWSTDAMPLQVRAEMDKISQGKMATRNRARGGDILRKK